MLTTGVFTARRRGRRAPAGLPVAYHGACSAQSLNKQAHTYKWETFLTSELPARPTVGKQACTAGNAVVGPSLSRSAQDGASFPFPPSGDSRPAVSGASIVGARTTPDRDLQRLGNDQERQLLQRSTT